MTRSILLLLRVQLISFLFILSAGCQKGNGGAVPSGFLSPPLSLRIHPGIIDEASGIADSKVNPGHLWIEEDSGNPNDIILMSSAAAVVKKVNIKPAVNRDWEDIVVSNGPVAGTNYIYIADIGDNNRIFSEYTIYRFPEPAAITDTVTNCDKIRFAYSDGSHNAEAILLDNSSKDIYILTKDGTVSRIYKLSYPQNTIEVSTAIYVGSFTFNEIVSAAISLSGKELLVKTYTSIYYWQRGQHETIEQVFQREPVKLDYQLEPQGEAICFKNDNSGFYTLSERPAGIAEVQLNFYKRR